MPAGNVRLFINWSSGVTLLSQLHEERFNKEFHRFLQGNSLHRNLTILSPVSS
jgi:hypothetical protein